MDWEAGQSWLVDGASYKQADSGRKPDVHLISRQSFLNMQLRPAIKKNQVSGSQSLFHFSKHWQFQVLHLNRPFKVI